MDTGEIAVLIHKTALDALLQLGLPCEESTVLIRVRIGGKGLEACVGVGAWLGVLCFCCERIKWLSAILHTPSTPQRLDVHGTHESGACRVGLAFHDSGLSFLRDLDGSASCRSSVCDSRPRPHHLARRRSLH